MTTTTTSSKCESTYFNLRNLAFDHSNIVRFYNKMGFACDLTVPKRKLVIGASKRDDLGIGKKEEILGMSSLPNEKTISEKKTSNNDRWSVCTKVCVPVRARARERKNVL